MNKLKFPVTLFLTIMLAVASFGTARAANNSVDTTPVPITGEVQNIVVVTDTNTQVTSVLVTLLDENNDPVDVQVTLDAAITLGLVTVEVNLDQIGLPLSIDPLTVIPDEGQDPPPVDVPIEGTISTIEVQTDQDTHVTTVVVTLEDDNQVQTPYRISLDTAISLGLVNVVVVDSMIGETITINPEDMVPQTNSKNPIDQILGNFLAKLLGVDPVVVNEYHADGMGYGVIAQAGILSYALDGDAAMMQAILDAKLSGDYSTIVLPDGTTPANWGQLRKSVMDREGSLRNLGNIISGHADQSTDTSTQTTNTNQSTNQSANGNNGNSHKTDKSNNGGSHPNNGKGNGH